MSVVDMNIFLTFLASEVIHHMRCKSMHKVGEVALKIDISKAFDRIE